MEIDSESYMMDLDSPETLPEATDELAELVSEMVSSRSSLTSKLLPPRAMDNPTGDPALSGSFVREPPVQICSLSSS